MTIGSRCYTPEEIDEIVNESEGIPGLTGKGSLEGKSHPIAISPTMILEIGQAFRYGQKKHGVNNFRQMTPEAMQGVADALMRHWFKYLSGEIIDPESGCHHLAHVGANLSMLYRVKTLYSDKEVISNISGGDVE